MSTLAAPIYTGTLNGKPLRFFRAPYPNPHLPWHSYDDLIRCIGTNQSDRDNLLRFIRNNCSYELQTVTFGSEIIITAPNYAARWFIKNLRGTMKYRKKADLMYRLTMIDAWYAFTNHLLAGERESTFWEALRNTTHAEATGYAA